MREGTKKVKKEKLEKERAKSVVEEGRRSGMNDRRIQKRNERKK